MGVYSGQWIVYFPWDRHQIEGTNGFYCLIRKTLASSTTVRPYSGSLAHPRGMYYNGKEGKEGPVKNDDDPDILNNSNDSKKNYTKFHLGEMN